MSHHLYYQAFTTWLHQHPEWGGIAAFFIAFAESVAILGTIIPGSITMTAIGILVGSGIIPIYSTVAFAVAGAVIGDVLSYFTGYYFKDGIRKIWPFRNHPNWLDRAALFFQDHGGKSVFFGRFIGPIRAMIPIIAGMLAMRPIKFFLFDLSAAIIWAPLYLLPGYLVGIAATALPARIATELILSLLALLVLITFILWLIKRTSAYVSVKVDRYLNLVWGALLRSSRWRWITNVLRDANHPNDHGQLVLSFVCLLAVIFFLLIFAHTTQANPFLPIDQFCYHFFRGLRFITIDRAVVLISSMGSQLTLSLVATIIFLWLLGTKNFWAAGHFLFVCLLTACLALLLQNLAYVHRPDGIQLVISTSSFPSVQVALSCALYGFLAWLICLQKAKWKKTVYWCAGIIIAFCMAARVYLGFHWVSDAIGSFFLGTACATFTAISYQRKLSPAPKTLSLSLIAIFAIIFSSALDIKINAQQLLIDSTPVWNQQVMDRGAWWSRRTEIIPLYRTSRLGAPAELLNLEWAGNLDAIRTELLAHGWVEVKHNFKEVILNQFQPAKKMTRVTILPTLYADQRPSLEMIKIIPHLHTSLMIRLWSANIMLNPEKIPLWVGTFNYIHPYGKEGWLKHSYHLISEFEAMPILIHSLPSNEWTVALRRAKMVPSQFLPSVNAPHYTILIQPQSPN